MKKNQGFALVETLIVSTIIATILVYIFVQFNALNSNYKESLKYNDVDDLYKLDSLSEYINSLSSTSINNIITKINNDGIIIMDKSNNTYSDIIYLDNQNSLLSNIGVKTLVLTKADLRSVDTSELSNNMKDMIKKINNKSDNYRIIAEFDNDNLATITISLEAS